MVEVRSNVKIYFIVVSVTIMLYRSLGESAGQFWQSAEFENVANQYFENLKHLQNPGDLLLAAASISLGNVPFQIHYLLESLFFCNIKGKNF